MNFHKDLLAMGQEVFYWERMRMPIPYIAMEINAQREKYRVLRDNILVVRTHTGTHTHTHIQADTRMHAHTPQRCTSESITARAQLCVAVNIVTHVADTCCH